jgi:hypothetical protein
MSKIIPAVDLRVRLFVVRSCVAYVKSSLGVYYQQHHGEGARWLNFSYYHMHNDDGNDVATFNENILIA